MKFCKQKVFTCANKFYFVGTKPCGYACGEFKADLRVNTGLNRLRTVNVNLKFSKMDFILLILIEVVAVIHLSTTFEHKTLNLEDYWNLRSADKASKLNIFLKMDQLQHLFVYFWSFLTNITNFYNK